MAPLPDNNSGRYFVDYVANGREHTVMFRYPAGALPNEPGIAFLESCREFLDEANAVMPSDYTLTGARYSASGTNFTVPLDTPVLEGTPTGTPDLANAPAFWTFIGRTLGGRQSKVLLIGVAVDPNDGGTNEKNYRLTSAENGTVTTMVATLNASGQCAIDNLEPNWYPYVNLGYHAYWQKALRS
jgi:hypothetical protein